MLESLKRWASGYVAFILIGLLIISVGFLGITDYFYGGAGRFALATVGDKEISANEFQRAFGNELNTLSRQAGQRITAEQARAVGLDNRVLSQLIGSTAVEAHADELELALSDRSVAQGLKDDPAFQVNGEFNRDLVTRMQRELGVTEAGLIDLRRKDELRNQITTAFLRATVVPDEMIAALNAWRGETRVISYFRIDPEKLEKPADPTDAELKEIYDGNLSRFMTAPRRDLEVLQISVADLKKKADIAEAEVKTAFEQTRTRYGVPEKRRIEQISFKDKATAQQALEEIKSGKDFLAIAKEAGIEEADAKLGVLTRSDMIDAAIAEAAFSLAKDEISGVVDGTFTTAIVRVTEIEPGKEATFEEFKDEVRDELATEWARNALRDYYGRVDDARGEGRPLKEIAAELQIPYFSPKGVTRGNVDAENKPALTVPDANAIVNAGFRAEIGLESEPIQLADGGFAWVDVTKIIKAEQKRFEDVKDEARQIFLERRRREILNDAASGYAQKLKDGGDLAKLAEEAGGKVETTSAIGRSTIPDGLSQAAVTQAFALRAGEIGNAETADGKSRTLFRVDKINEAPAPSDETKTRMREELLQQLRTDSLAAYVAALQERYGVDINQRTFRQLTGAEDQP